MRHEIHFLSLLVNDEPAEVLFSTGLRPKQSGALGVASANIRQVLGVPRVLILYGVLSI